MSDDESKKPEEYAPFSAHQAQRKKYEEKYPNGGPLPMAVWLKEIEAPCEGEPPTHGQAAKPAPQL